MGDLESATRSDALLKEAAVTEAEQRAAGIALAGLALASAKGDKRAATWMLRDVLETCGLMSHDEPSQPYKQRGIETLTTNYERPRRST